MHTEHNTWTRARMAAAGLALTLAGCGGGSTSTVVPAPTPTPTPVTLSGVAAQGAPMQGAAISVVDATGAVVATATSGEDGHYTLIVPVTAKPPFVVSASKDDIVYYAPVAEAKTSTVNVTKLTNLIAAQLSPTGDPSALASQVASGAARVDLAQVQAVVSAVVQALQPLLQSVGDATDPISGSFDANGSGHDKVLMALDISLIPRTNGTTVSITVKAAVADGDQAPEIRFASGSTPPPLPAQVATAELPASDTDTLVADFMTRLNACYALPVAQRVNGTTAASVVAPECRQLFTQDDPTKFKNNGATVGANGAFSGLFRDGATGVTFTNPVVEFLRPGGRLLVSWKNTDTQGGITYNRTWTQTENGALKATGNGYDYSFTVRAWSETRDFLNRPELSYWGTGFEVNIANRTSGGSPIFDHVVITGPLGRTVTLRPNAGLSYLPVEGSSTSVVRLAGQFMDASTSGVPRRLSGIPNGENLVWAKNLDGSDTDWTDEEIMAINNVGRWKADFYLASDPATIAATQYYETLARPLGIAELQARQWATPVAAAREDGIAASSGTGSIALGGEPLDLSAGSGTDFWTVPAGANAPTLIQAQGFVANAGNPPPRWNDNTGVSSVARKASISCSPQTVGDLHCGATAGTYSSNARLSLVQMFAYDAKDMEWVTSVATSLLSGIQ